jgi:hypothetical protein
VQTIEQVERTYSTTLGKKSDVESPEITRAGLQTQQVSKRRKNRRVQVLPGIEMGVQSQAAVRTTGFRKIRRTIKIAMPE